MNNLSLIYSPFPDLQSAEKIANLLLERNFAACCNIIQGVTSLYRWEGELCREQEFLLLVKTSPEQAASAQGLIKENHPYDLPCVLLCSVDANAEFAAWVLQNTANNANKTAK